MNKMDDLEGVFPYFLVQKWMVKIMKNLIKMDDLGCFSIFFGSKMDGEHNEKPYYIKWDDLGGKLPYFCGKQHLDLT